MHTCFASFSFLSFAPARSSHLSAWQCRLFVHPVFALCRVSQISQFNKQLNSRKWRKSQSDRLDVRPVTKQKTATREDATKTGGGRKWPVDGTMKKKKQFNFSFSRSSSGWMSYRRYQLSHINFLIIFNFHFMFESHGMHSLTAIFQFKSHWEASEENWITWRTDRGSCLLWNTQTLTEIHSMEMRTRFDFGYQKCRRRNEGW